MNNNNNTMIIKYPDEIDPPVFIAIGTNLILGLGV
jgi:hypothetical protein